MIPPFYTPVYSNLAYQILSYALENITGRSFQDMFETYLVEAHNLRSTTYSIPQNASNSIIPINATLSSYNLDLLDGSVYGDYSSTITDLTTLGRAILNSTFLPPAQTRHWLKPLAFLPPNILTDNAVVYQAVGAPWEIIRAPAPSVPLSKQPIGSNATAAQTYQTWMYTKEGDLGAYSSLMALIPEFDVGFEILAAGTSPHNIVLQVAEIVTEAFSPITNILQNNLNSTYQSKQRIVQLLERIITYNPRKLPQCKLYVPASSPAPFLCRIKLTSKQAPISSNTK